MSPRWRAVAGLAALALVTTGMSACQNSITLPNSDVDYCTIIADPPDNSSKAIEAPGRFRCDGKGATTITLKVTLEKQASSGSWKTVKSGTFVIHGKDTTRSLSESARTRRVKVGCASGHFRTVVRAVEKSNGHSQVYNSHSPSVPNPCKSSF